MSLSDPARVALVVEDDPDIGALLATTLTSHGFAVRCAASGPDALRMLAEVDPDVITLDLGLPGLDGLEVCRRLRSGTDAYILMITARDAELDRLIGLEVGADDYIVKPFSPREVLARINAMFRRPRQSQAPAAPDHEASTLTHGALTVDEDAHLATYADETLVLTPTEFQLLACLMREPGRVRSREALLAEVWGEEWEGDTHLVEVHVGNLRRKLERVAEGRKVIGTVRGVGYRLEPA